MNNMNKEEIKKVTRKNLEIARDLYVENEGLSLMFILDATDNQDKKINILNVLADQKTLDRRQDVAFEIGIKVGIMLGKKELKSVESISAISESWFSDSKEMKDGKYDRPSLDPKRKEGILATILTKDEVCHIEMFEVLKKWDEKKNIVVEFKDYGPDELKEDDGVSTRAPLLERFWDGVHMLEAMRKNMPEDVLSYFMKGDTDEIFHMIVGKIKENNAKL
jgi:hypothetical protein